MWALQPCNPIKLPSKKKRKEIRQTANSWALPLSPPLPLLFSVFLPLFLSLSAVTEMNSWASDLSCTDSNYCCCCLLLTPVNRMSHEKTHGRRETWSWGVPCVFVCDTVERGGQCLNVTTLLFAVNYRRGQGYWLCNSTEQTFSPLQWSWRKKNSLLLACFFFLAIKNEDRKYSRGWIPVKEKVSGKWNYNVFCSVVKLEDRFLAPSLLIF